jgi:CheY-like chemotaxis protein
VTQRNELRILIVDDDPTIIRLLSTLITGEGFPEPTHVLTGAEAFAASEGVDVVLLDYDLPDMKGTEVLESLSHHPDPPSVILITAHGDESVAATALRHGADDYLLKDATLLQMVPQVIERVRRNRALRASLSTAEQDLMAMERRTAMGQMTVTLHHEINNPLMSAMADVELMIGEPDTPPAQRETLREVLRSLERIRDIVRQVGALQSAETVEYLDGVEMVDLDAKEVVRGEEGPALVYVKDEQHQRVISLLLSRAGYSVTRCETDVDLTRGAAALGIRLVVAATETTPGSTPFGSFHPAAERTYKLVAMVPDDGASAVASGADHVIRLPFDPGTFIEEISGVV